MVVRGREEALDGQLLPGCASGRNAGMPEPSVCARGLPECVYLYSWKGRDDAASE